MNKEKDKHIARLTQWKQLGRSEMEEHDAPLQIMNLDHYLVWVLKFIKASTTISFSILFVMDQHRLTKLTNSIYVFLGYI